MSPSVYSYKKEPEKHLKLTKQLIELSIREPSWGFSRLFEELPESHKPATFSIAYRTYRKLGLREKRLAWFQMNCPDKYPHGNSRKGGHSWIFEDVSLYENGEYLDEIAAWFVHRSEDREILGVIQEPVKGLQIKQQLEEIIQANKKPRYIRIRECMRKTRINYLKSWCKGQGIVVRSVPDSNRERDPHLSKEYVRKLASEINPY